MHSARPDFAFIFLEIVCISSATQFFVNSPPKSVPWSTGIFPQSVFSVSIFNKNISFFWTFCLYSFGVECSVKPELVNKQKIYAIITCRQFFNKCRIHAPSFVLRSHKHLHSSEFAGNLNISWVESVWVQKMLHFPRWKFPSSHQFCYRTVCCSTFIVWSLLFFFSDLETNPTSLVFSVAFWFKSKLGVISAASSLQVSWDRCLESLRFCISTLAENLSTKL